MGFCYQIVNNIDYIISQIDSLEETNYSLKDTYTIEDIIEDR